MKLFIAEKPALAKSIAAGIDGEYKNGDDFFQKGENIITWAFGHLLELYMPEDYDENFKKWDLKDLPLKIDEFKYKPIQSSKEQLKIICNLIKRSDVDTIINCGDADEEGQILIDEILIYSKTNKPVLRALLQDLTEKGIRKSLGNLKSNNDFKGMSEAGFARSQADWLVGINMTRAYTIKAREAGYKGVLSVGRVQTPILGLIVNRDLARESHKKSFYYTIEAFFNTQGLDIKTKLKTKNDILDKTVAENIVKDCENMKAGLVTKVVNEEKKEYPPLPYNLLLLQSECNKKFGYKPDKTLEITQSLREKYKLISYNRSDCQYLPENLFEESPEILEAIKSNFNNDNYKNLVENADLTIKGYAFNDKNITAHYGIIPTTAKVDLSNLTKDEYNVYELISKRFALQFYEPKEYLHTSIEIGIADYVFSCSSNKTLKAGYTLAFKETDESSDEENNSDEISLDLSLLSENKEAILSNIKFSEKETKPKPYYTLSTLLTDLTQISKYVTDDRIKTLLREKDKGKKGESGGIGTPATRSEHIKTLFDREFIIEKGKSIISTQMARDFIKLLPDTLTKPDMTALWYEEQKDIQSGNLSRTDFLSEVTKEVAKQIEEIKEDKKLNENFSGIDKTYPCKCGKGYLQKRHSQKTNKDFWGCSDWKNGCKEIYPDKNGKPNIPKYFCPECGSPLARWKNKKGNGYYWSCSGWKTKGCKIGFIEDEKSKPKIYKKG